MLIDLGGTLVDYYTRAEFPAVLAESMAACRRLLAGRGIAVPEENVVLERAQAERHEGADLKVRPLEGRLARVFFPGGPEPDAGIVRELCTVWLGPVFARARRCEETIGVLEDLRRRGMATAVVSNMPWGCPREPWDGELRQQGIAERMPHFVTCRDAGWRKPDRRIFDLAARTVGVPPEACLFVGDEPVWDVQGALAAGMRAVLVDRAGAHECPPGARRIGTLEDLPALI